MSATKRFFALLVGIAVAILALAATASAATHPPSYPPPPGGGGTVSNTTPTAGGTVGVSGGGATPDGQVSISEHSAAVHLATVRANATGHYSAHVKLAPNLTGSHHIVVTDVTTGRVLADIPITVKSSGTTNNGGGGGLASTGVAVAGIGGLGVLLVIGGGIALFAGRRRKAPAAV